MVGEPLGLLLVEDDPEDVTLLRELLAEADPTGFRLQVASRLAEARRLLADRTYDAILLDLSLPDSQGLETFILMRLAAPEVPIVVLTGLDDRELAIRAVQTGAQDYLVKGRGDGEQLARALRHAVERQRHLDFETLLLERECFDAAISQMNDGLLVTDADGRLNTANRAARLLLNLPDGTWPGMYLAQVLAPFEGAPDGAVLMDSGGERSQSFTLARNTRPPLHLDVQLTRLLKMTGDFHGLVLTVRDVSAGLHSRHPQADFLQLLSHKLRTPLAVLLGYHSLFEALPEPERHQLWPEVWDVMGGQLRRLDDVVARLLDFHRAGSGSWANECVALEPLVAQVVEKVRRRYPERTLIVESQLPAEAAWADAGFEDLDLVLGNLIDNAAKFAERSQVRIQVGAERQTDGWLHILVRDDGPGIPSEFHDRIFAGFLQVEDRSTGQVPGLGVGLHIARRVIEAYGGQIAVESRLGAGSTFVIRLPAR